MKLLSTRVFSFPSVSRYVSHAVMALLFALTLGFAGTATILAQDASPTSSRAGLADLGYPELRIVVTDEGFEAPSEAPAGRTLVVLENQGTPGGPAQVTDINFLQLPEGVAVDELNALITSDDGAVPDWYDDIVSTGGFKVAAGETGYGVIDLEAGDWVVGAGDTNPFVALVVSGEGPASPSAAAEPEADVIVEFVEFSFEVPEQLSSDNLVWHVTNGGAQPHEIMLVKTPESLMAEQVVTLLTLPEGEAPPAGLPDPATLEFVALGAQTMSAGREIWFEMELESGFYAAFCPIPDSGSGAPHGALGEIRVFTVDD
jgi:hypothetical protein